MARKLIKKNTKIIKKVVKKLAPAENSRRNAASARANIQLPSGKYFGAVGRRKVANARVRIWDLPGDYIVNGQAAGTYFDEVIEAPTRYNRPLEVVGLKGKLTISANVKGSGVSSQIDAVVHGLARALVKFNADFKPLLKEAGLLTRDDRMKETRKIGMGGKARRQRQSPRR